MNSALAIVEGIQNVGTGKRCVDCSAELVDAIYKEIRDGVASKAIQGAFLGALFFKPPTDTELKLEELGRRNCLRSSTLFINQFLSTIPTEIQGFAKSLLDKMDLSKGEAKALGRFLLLDDNDFAKGFFASVLRIKYETVDEYLGLIEAMEEIENFCNSSAKVTGRVIQLAEPFDGANRSYLFTPVIIEALQQEGFKSLCMCGESAGPKYGNTLLGLAQELKSQFYINRTQLESIPDTGLFINQNDFFPRLVEWQRIRREIKKRPFMATIEKMINPFGARIGILSSFHGRYAEMILDVALNHSFDIVVGVFKGLEGGLTPSSSRPVHITLAYKDASGVVIKEKRVFAPEDFGYAIPAIPVGARSIMPQQEFSQSENSSLLKKYKEHPELLPVEIRDHMEYTKKVYQAVARWIKEIE